MRVPDATLSDLMDLIAQCGDLPWKAWIEGRDHESGDSFIATGPSGSRSEDIYVTRDSGPAPAEYLDLIAQAMTHLPDLVQEIRERRL